MKTRFLIICTFVLPLVILIPQTSFSLLAAQTPEELYDSHHTIIKGKILDYTAISLRQTLYDVEVIEYLKNPQEDKIIQATGDGVSDARVSTSTDRIFHTNDVVLLYLYHKDDSFTISPYSRMIVEGDFVNPHISPYEAPSEVFAEKEIIPPPLKQVKLGVKIGLIVCDEDKILVYNVHYKPACVFEESEMKLIKNGWAKLRLLLPASPFPANEMELTGRNVMSMMLVGTVTIGENRLETYDEKRAAVWEYAQEYYPGEAFLEYSIVFPPHDRHYYQGDRISFDLLGWGNYADCWDLNIRIFDTSGYVLYEDNLSKGCQEPPSTPGTFNSYSIGKDEEEIVCEKPGFYMIEVSNGDIYPPTILQNFACLQ